MADRKLTARNGNIELLRFLFAVSVFLLHCRIGYCKNGYLGVEFFFMLSGIFMGRKLSKVENAEKEPVSVTVKDSCSYLLKRLKSIYPYFIVSVFIGFVVMRLSLYTPIKSFVWLPTDLAFLQNYGFHVISTTGTIWFLSAMFFAIWLVYPLARRYYSLCSRYLSLVVCFLITGYLENNFPDLDQPNTFCGIFNTGFLRAVSMIFLGLFINEAASVLCKFKLNKRTSYAVTVFEIIIYCIVFAYIVIPKERSNYDQVFVFIIALALIVTLSSQSLTYGKFDNKFVMFLGKMSMILFMNHFYWVRHFGYYLRTYKSFSEGQSLAVTVAATAVTCLTVYFLGNLIIKAFQKINFKKIFLKEE